MALVTDHCICLRRHEYSETSQILSLLGRSRGLFRVIAKGAHRRTKAGASKFDGGVDLLDVGDAAMTDPADRELATLTEWKLRDGNLAVRRKLRSLHLAVYSAELVGLLLQENDPHPEVFDLLVWLMGELSGERVEEAFVGFELELLRRLGYLPSLDFCRACGQEITGQGEAWLIPHDGSVACGQCGAPPNQRVPLDGRVLRMIQLILKLPQADGRPQRLPRLSRAQSDPINELLLSYLQETGGRRLKTARYVVGDQAGRK
jgi:DNA repair protein RecO (recombination protein O)